MRTVGTILIILQCIALFGAISTGADIFQIVDIRSFFRLIGFFWFAILGAILIILGNRKKNRKKEK